MYLSYVLLFVVSVFFTACIEDPSRPEIEADIAGTADRAGTTDTAGTADTTGTADTAGTVGMIEPISQDEQLRTDQDFCEALQPKQGLREIEGVVHLFGGCGTICFYNAEGYWIYGPGLTDPILVSAPDEVIVDMSALSDPYFLRIHRFDGDVMILDLHGGWLSEPFDRVLASALVVQLHGQQRGILYQKRNFERNLTELKLFSQGQTQLIAEGNLPYSLRDLPKGDIRRKVAFYDEEGAWVIEFDHPDGPQIEPLELEDFRWQPTLEYVREVRQDQVLIDRLGKRLLHIKYGITELDHYYERTFAEATLYQLDTMEPIVSRRDEGSHIGIEPFFDVCLMSDVKMSSGCVVDQDLMTLYAANGTKVELEGERFGSDAYSQTLWRRQEDNSVNHIYDMETGIKLGEIPPYALPRFNRDELNLFHDDLDRQMLSSSLLITRRNEDQPELPSLYYVDLLEGEHYALLDAEHQVIRLGSKYYSTSSYQVNGPQGNELRWYIKREGELKTIKIPLSMLPESSLGNALDGRLFKLIEEGSVIELYDAEYNTTQRYQLPRHYHSLSARAYSFNEETPGLVLVHDDVGTYDRFLIGFLTRELEIP